jgi:hypothetical protein
LEAGFATHLKKKKEIFATQGNETEEVCGTRMLVPTPLRRAAAPSLEPSPPASRGEGQRRPGGVGVEVSLHTLVGDGCQADPQSHHSPAVRGDEIRYLRAGVGGGDGRRREREEEDDDGLGDEERGADGGEIRSNVLGATPARGAFMPTKGASRRMN